MWHADGMLASRARVLTVVLALALGTGCRGSAYDIARRDDEGLRSKVDTLLLLVSVANAPTAAGAEPAPGPRYMDASRIIDVTLAVDGKPLGKFRTVRGEGSKAPAALDRVVTAEQDAALVRADFAELYDVATLKTVGDWVKALSRTVGTGTHVLEVTGITLQSDGPTPVTRAARAFLPFSVADGASTAFAGRVELVLPGAAP